MMSFLSLLGVSAGLVVFIGIAAAVVGVGVGLLIANAVLSKKAGKSKSTAVKIVENAYAEAKTIKKEAVLEAKEEILKLKTDLDREIKERRSEIQKSEDRMAQREDIFDKRELALEKKQEQIDNSKREIEKKEAKVDGLKQEQEKIKNDMIVKLETISGLKREEAKKIIIDQLTESAQVDAAKMVVSIENEAKEEANKRAQNIVALAIQRCATDHTADITVSTVTIPNDEMKGRIIGREGRNIRAIESAVGIDLIVDDTPEVITISGFDPIRREIARRSLEKLILDGRIHPARIEEIVEKVRREVDQIIKEAGENAVHESGVFGLHPELVKLLGRLKYRTSYGQNCLQHSLETSYIAGLLAGELGADEKLAKRAGLLHDIGKAVDFEMEGTHITIGVDLAKKFKENEAVVHCIEAHHGGVEFKSVEAILVQVADAISSSRPGARRESLELYIKRLKQLEGIANSFKGVDTSYAIQAGREVRIIVKPEEVSDEKAVFLAKDIAKKIEDEMEYPGQIKVNVIRECRFSETAK